jgi:hypothetical protein
MGNSLAELFTFEPDTSIKIDEQPAIEGGWFRYEDRAAYDDYSPARIVLRCMRVIRETAKGVWLDDWSVPRFVLKDARKRFAYPTIELARKSFLIRKRHQVGHLSRQHDHAVAILKRAEELFV